MMEESKQEFGQKFSACQSCGCMGHSHGCGGSGHYHGHFLLRWLLGILLLGIVFAMGVKLGEFKSGFYGYGNMRHESYGLPMMQQRPMMYYTNGEAVGNGHWAATTTPTTVQK